MESKIGEKRYWNPLKSTVESVPNKLVISHEQPGIMATAHWHAQVEINYVFSGSVDYQMQGRSVHLAEGDMCLFWGGLPHRVVDTSENPLFIAIHLPLVHFFRLRLPSDIQQRLMRGATLLPAEPDPGDHKSFARWSDYLRSADPARVGNAIDELLLRIERVQFENYRLLDATTTDAAPAEAPDRQSFHNIGKICSYIAANFRHDIDSSAIASSVDIHPKYAMSVFKKSTGMTLNEYVSLLRLSYAQSLLLRDETNVLGIAMESGFGSLSAFNATFRRLAGMSPTDYRRAARDNQALVVDH
ncbi:helix-turn-helix domain-containing protein [Pelagibacterium sp. 26DY04]|uniref:helix-turn-helix domain-containing protein n=1 Tax=Pelagibacterium sp. 26DY04 TaxID=2967130 RepID=UPI002815728D|nr:helix-turn-helix domain-containing protein [Pelagibacterium sp. 26DY04]WMT85780.1 helix-turn-helix domain-containing protein [Pelagibacterium sp. 26DY04]